MITDNYLSKIHHRVEVSCPVLSKFIYEKYMFYTVIIQYCMIFTIVYTVYSI